MLGKTEIPASTFLDGVDIKLAIKYIWQNTKVTHISHIVIASNAHWTKFPIHLNVAMRMLIVSVADAQLDEYLNKFSKYANALSGYKVRHC